jgi:hypothetical protein
MRAEEPLRLATGMTKCRLSGAILSTRGPAPIARAMASRGAEVRVLVSSVLAWRWLGDRLEVGEGGGRPLPRSADSLLCSSAAEVTMGWAGLLPEVGRQGSSCCCCWNFAYSEMALRLACLCPREEREGSDCMLSARKSDQETLSEGSEACWNCSSRLQRGGEGEGRGMGGDRPVLCLCLGSIL